MLTTVHNTPPTGEVIPFTPSTATHITNALLDRAKAEAHCLPPGLFTISLVRETGDDDTDVMDHVAIDRVTGPPASWNYQVRRERGRFLVLRLVDDEDGDLGFFCTMAAALRAVRADVEAEWSSWGMAIDIDQAFRSA